MQWMRILCLLLVINVLYWLAGCASENSLPESPLQSNLIPYSTRARVIVPSVTPLVSQTPVPTPTQFIYKVARDDTMSAIARRFGVSLEALLAANPGIPPQALSIGQTLTIPAVSPGTAASAQFSTPVPLDLGPGFCQPSTGGTTCLIPVHNPYPQTLENIRLQVTLFDESGQPLANQEAILPLNILPPEQVLPAAVFFRGITAQASAQAQLITSMSLAVGDSRYLRTSIQNLLISVSWDGLSATAQGEIFLPETEKPASNIWLVAVAADASGEIIGYRRWEWSGLLQPGASQAFTLPVYSLGPQIQHVDVLVEARP